MWRALALAGLVLTAEAAVAEAGGGHAVTFMYHRFGESDYSATNVTLEQFQAHLDYLDEEDYNVWPLRRIVEHIDNGEPLPERTVAITIDDAYLSVYEEAYPRLEEKGFPYTVFVATEPVDIGLSGYMSWDQMREMQRDGNATFANHSASHDYLVRQGEDESGDAYRERLREDITEARERLQDELGDEATIPDLFAYPYGEYDHTVADVVRELGYVGVGQHSGAIGRHSDLRALPRYPMAEMYADMEGFREKARTRALPVTELEPWDPVAANETNPPRLRVTLAESDARLDQLSCFVGLQGQVEVEWIDRDARIFEVQPPDELSEGRTRYNCTAPSPEPGQFYWFSQQWIVLPD